MLRLKRKSGLFALLGFVLSVLVFAMPVLAFASSAVQSSTPSSSLAFSTSQLNKFNELSQGKIIDIVAQSPNNIVYVPGANAGNKADFLKSVSTLNKSGNMLPQSLSPWYASGFNSEPYSNGTLESSFNDTVTASKATFKVVGNSYAEWAGTSPFDANEIVLSDAYTFTGINVSVSASGPGLSVSGNTVNWSATQPNTWYLGHSYNGIQATGADVDYSHSASSSFLFGTQWYQVVASGSAVLW
jgi:hypothetical protein